MTHSPTARRDGLIVRELDGETLVYDLERDEAHCLNRTAALVWKHCDGRLTVAEITKLIEDELQETVDERVVWLALSQLRGRRLLTERMPRTRSSLRISRRELARKLAQAVVIALPLITTIAAPTRVDAGSLNCSTCGMPPTAECCATGCPCQSGGICCTGICASGSCT
jgi:hypothetical protein